MKIIAFLFIFTVFACAEKLVDIEDFKSLTGKTSDEWIGKGLSASLINKLQNVNGITILEGKKNKAEIVIKGEYQRAGDTLRITARIVNNKDSKVKASFEMTGGEDKIFDLQDQIAGKIVASPALSLEAGVSVPKTASPKSPEVLKKYSEGLALKRAAKVKGDFEKAKKVAEEVAKIDPEFTPARELKGDILKEMGEFKASEQNYKSVLQKNPRNAAVHEKLGGVYEVQGNKELAMDHYEQALKIKPDNQELQKKYGKQLKQAGTKLNMDEEILKSCKLVEEKRYNSAISLLKRLQSYDDKDPLVDYNLACAYSLLANGPVGVKHLENTLKKGFRKWDIIESDKDLKNVRANPKYKQLKAKYK